MRVKALVSHIPSSFDVFEKSLLENNYDPEHKGLNFGFDVYGYDKKKIDAKFIERIEVRDKIIDPFGNEEYVDSTRYNFIDFSIYDVNGKVVCLVFNPSRSIASLVNAMSDIAGFGFSVRNANLDVVQAYGLTKAKKDVYIKKISSVKVQDIYIDAHATAKIEIKSSKNALEDLEGFLQDRRYSVSKISFDCSFGPLGSNIELSNSGLILLSEEAFDFFEDLIVHHFLK